MIRMGTGPLPHLLQASSEGLAGASVVDVLHVDHFEPGFAHDPIGIEVRIRRKLRSSNHRRPRRMGVEPAFAISVDIKFDLTNPAIELLRKRLMLIVKTLVSVCILGLPDLAFVGRDTSVIAVVRPNDLNLINLKRSVTRLAPYP